MESLVAAGAAFFMRETGKLLKPPDARLEHDEQNIAGVDS